MHEVYTLYRDRIQDGLGVRILGAMQVMYIDVGPGESSAGQQVPYGGGSVPFEPRMCSFYFCCFLFSEAWSNATS